MTFFFAHSTDDSTTSNWQSLDSHLKGVAALAREKAQAFGCAELAQVQGLLHDLGKYTLPFQQRLRGDPQRVDHSTHGARMASQRFDRIGRLLAYGIAGHHAGLANGSEDGERRSLANRLAADLPALESAWEREIVLPGKLGLPATFRPYGKSRIQGKERMSFQLAFLTRMLFSCLVDADFIDTERYYLQVESRADLRSQGREFPTLQMLRVKLEGYLQGFRANSEVNRLRADILQHVRQQATRPPGLFSLTVPTGGGKTLASLAFALDHAIRHGLRRIIFVIPFTSIVEQNAAVFRTALGELGSQAVLEHHSAFLPSDPPRADPDRYQSEKKLSLAMENWEAPIVVTTSVQFFESLFAARPSQCRKLHNIAGSVVVLDEAQTMPLKLLRPSVAAIDELARNYRSSVVLCTATQPVLQAPGFEGGLEQVYELAPDLTRLFDRLDRVRVHHVGVLGDQELSQHLRTREQVLCIVNNRRHARAMYLSVADLPGARHLSTLMCAKHRSAVLAEVRQMLKEGKPCRLVSTSLIEAGVDVDFPTVLRAEAGLDSIAQAAGRCNREGRRDPDASEVLVFTTVAQEWQPPAELRQYAQVAHEVLRQFENDPLSPKAMERYFSLLYWKKGSEQLDVPDMMGLLKRSDFDSLPMETMAAKFRMIDSMQMPVIVPWDENARQALQDLEFSSGCGELARKLQPYVVEVPRQGFEALYAAGAIVAVAENKWGGQFMTLAHEGLYDLNFGLSWDDPSHIRAEHLII
ncbi:CRISPR-associated endonuclease Cas3'' [Bordetella avium]|uniref:CRISPR-associated endonuclease Cas3'' n=1 Tax=Bordetella avium TaxID=521 RepID=UPI000E69649A|nr:CRISPR-associated endonuclease Cas3'' [Bordetella avium]RIQ18696.1 CRISPR-associated endonuclease Cas3'' [Bordetella avium]RIQ35268.1 CRISPR-associated endonuclease Cas3'' [Bordetella avium]